MLDIISECTYIYFFLKISFNVFFFISVFFNLHVY